MKAAKRHSLPAGDFVYPAREGYPINDKAHARNALARAAQKGTRGSYAAVAAKVKAKYPDIKTKGTTAKKNPAKKTAAKAKRK